MSANKYLAFLSVYFVNKLQKLFSVSKRRKYKLLYNISIGGGTTIEKGEWIRPFAKLSIGSECYIGRNVIFDVGSDLQRCKGLTIGDKTWISQNCLLQTAGNISIGENVLIGEYSSIRDATHSYHDLQEAIKDQPSIVGELTIENNVWIGRGCLILGRPGGIKIGAGSIIGANSVVTQSIEKNTIWGGVPARLIKVRE